MNLSRRQVEGDCIALPLVPFVMSVLKPHVKEANAAVDPYSAFANAGAAMLVDSSDLWNKLL